MKKSFLVVLLILVQFIHPIISMAHPTTRTIYVDDDNIVGPWDGTMEHPYQLIQDGINASVDGDTVFVNSGIYHEELVIDESIILDGKDRNTTIIQGSNGFVVGVSANSVHVSGFTIQNGSYGIITEHSNHSTITSNTIEGNSGFGIWVSLSASTIISGNTIVTNGYDIALNYGSDHTITDNVINGNDFSGILLGDSSNNMIAMNVIEKHKDCGISIGWGSSENTITGNTIAANSRGILIFRCTNENIITGNAIETNDVGVQLDLTMFTTINDNNFINNSRQASFSFSFPMFWSGNYWDDWVLPFPRPINGLCWITFDWYPAKEPYNIP